VAVVCLLLTAPRAHAADPRDPALAETLFQEGRKLLEAQDYAAACPKLAESQRLDPATGTLMALAMCHQAQGRTATAWAEYLDVAAASKREGRADRQRVARARIQALEGMLASVSVSVSPGADVPSLVVQRDGVVLRRATWNVPSPVDPGEHVIEARAPGKKAWTSRVTVHPRAAIKVVVPPLENDPAAGAASAATPVAQESPPSEDRPPEAQPTAQTHEESASRKPSQRTIGYAVGAVGIVATGVGLYAGLRAIGSASDAKSQCGGSAAACRDPRGVDTMQDARTSALVSNIAIGAGLAAVAAGVYLVLTAPKPAAEPRAAVAVRPEPHGAAIWLTRAF
jgi:hypothetical protein